MAVLAWREIIRSGILGLLRAIICFLVNILGLEVLSHVKLVLDHDNFKSYLLIFKLDAFNTDLADKVSPRKEDGGVTEVVPRVTGCCVQFNTAL